MKSWLSIICIGTLVIYCQAEEKALSSAIKQVTVYADRAAVTRHAEVQLPAGQHELRFENLPVLLDNNSLQINAEGTTPTTILDVTAKQEQRITNANVRIQEINNKIQAITDEINALADKTALLDNQADFIKQMQMGVLAPSKDASRPSAQEIKNIMQFSKDNLANIFASQRLLAKQKNELEKQLQVLQSELAPIQQQQNSQVKNIVIRVNLEQAGKVNLDLTYVTYGAYWYPNYDARFNTKDRKVSLDYLGVISQQTGEDWKNVKLTLSTAKPSLGGNPPLLTNWIIDEYKPPVAAQAAYRDAPITAMPAPDLAATTDAADYLAKDLRQKNKASVQTATVDMGATSASFNIEKEASLMSDNSQRKVTITRIDLPSKLHYMITPRLAETAYLQAESNNSSDYPLIGGKLNIFMDNRFIASSDLKTTMPKEDFKLDLGADESINVQFKRLQRFTEKTGFTNSSQRITYEYLITVQNNKKTAESINIIDHIPVSENDKIKINLLSPNAKDIKQDKDGKLTWNWTLNAGQKREATLKFSIEYPINMQVIGIQ